MSNTFVQIEIVDVTCGVPGCGVHFGLERVYHDARRRDGKQFYCPNGHHVAWNESELDKIRAEKLRLESSLDWTRKQRDEAQKETITQKQRASRFKNDRDRIKTRVSNGVCPCCNRQFAQLRQHMSTKHPGYAKDDATQ